MKASISTYAKYPLILMAVAMIAACSGVSFTHADDVAGGSITNAEVQPGSTVILTYPDGSACIDTRSHEGRTCQLMVQPVVPAVTATPAESEDAP